MAYLRIKAQSWHKSLACRVYGHVRSGYHDGIPYGRVDIAAVDALETRHAEVSVNCDRCNEPVAAVRFHVPKDWEIPQDN